MQLNAIPDRAMLYSAVLCLATVLALLRPLATIHSAVLCCAYVQYGVSEQCCTTTMFCLEMKHCSAIKDSYMSNAIVLCIAMS
jgi:hypothetical protein